jgi:hypothetical protein
MTIATQLLGLLQGESLFIHMVPEEPAIKVTAKFIRPDSPEQGSTRIIALEDARRSPDQVLANAVEDCLAELRKMEARVM